MNNPISTKTYTLADIRALNPCYDPSQYLPEDWEGTIVDGLSIEAIPAQDRIWAATALLDDRTNRLFAVWCAREALKLIDNPDPRSINACDVAEKFANEEASREELAAAWAPAEAATGAAAWAATGAAAWIAVWAAANPTVGAAVGAAQISKLIEIIREKRQTICQNQ